MSRRVLLTRRELLRIGALAGGGLALAIGLPPGALPAEPTPSAPPEPPTRFAPNAWIRIHGDGRIVLVVARSEMGQGVTTALPMLIAEELEVPLDRIRVESAPVATAYVNRLLGQQATGGSTSVREAWTALREAGAVARELLVAAAALVWGVPESECRAANGRVTHADGKRSLDYGELASLAATLPVPESVLLKDPEEWTLVGTPQPRLDTPDKVAGRARFGIDVRLPGMVFASIERCPVLGGRARRWDLTAAKASPGVLDVLKIASGFAVVAGDTWSALRGRRVLVVDWDPLGNARLDSAGLRRRFRRALDKRGALAHEAGDARGMLESAATRVEAEYEVPFQAHACMEPMCCTARVADGRCDIHVPTQSQTRTLETARRLTGLPEDRISVHTTYLGGGFGRRGEQDFVADAVTLAKRLGRPVQVVWTREDDIRHDFYRPMTLNRMQAGLDPDGNPVAWVHRIVGPSILARVRPAAIRDGIDPTSVEGAANLPYALPAMRVEYRRADTPVPVGFWRSVGSSQNAFAVECFLDELARAAGRDPLQMRRDLLAGRKRHLRVLDTAARHAGWGGPLPAGRARGIALAESFGSIVAQVAEIAIADGQVRVARVVCAVDCGQVVNPDTVRAQMRGGIVFGLTATLKGAITIAAGRVEQGNFDDYPLLRASESPQIDVHILPSAEPPGGVGEPGTPPIAPAVANAVFAATGQPVRTLPIGRVVPLQPPEPPRAPRPEPGTGPGSEQASQQATEPAADRAAEPASDAATARPSEGTTDTGRASPPGGRAETQPRHPPEPRPEPRSEPDPEKDPPAPRPAPGPIGEPARPPEPAPGPRPARPPAPGQRPSPGASPGPSPGPSAAPSPASAPAAPTPPPADPRPPG